MAVHRHSRQREQILQFLKARKDHPTADVVYTNVRMQNPSISLGTVYRNLTLLTETGEINRLNMGDGVDHFDADTSPHYHFVCQKCGKVMDLLMNDRIKGQIKNIEEITASAAENFEGHIAGHVTYFYGTCCQCKEPEFSQSTAPD